LAWPSSSCEEVEAQVHAVTDRVALRWVDAVPLVDGNDERTALLVDQAEQARVLLRDRVARIDDADHDVRHVDRLQRLDDAPLLEALIDFRPAANACRIDQLVMDAVTLERHMDCVARRARLVECDEAILPHQPIDQR
jgi:hypothetical protein